MFLDRMNGCKKLNDAKYGLILVHISTAPILCPSSRLEPFLAALLASINCLDPECGGCTTKDTSIRTPFSILSSSSELWRVLLLATLFHQASRSVVSLSHNVVERP